MLRLLNKKKKETTTLKPQINLTATLLSALCPGSPAVFLYNGNLIRTSAVQAILEESSELVSFETKNSIYNLSCNTPPHDVSDAAA